MRKGLIIALCLTGCDGLFEENPDYSGSTGEVADTSGGMGSTSSPASSASTSSGDSPTSDTPAASSSSGEATDSEIPTECDEDQYEPNEGQPEVAQVASITSEGSFEITANIETSADEDWFKTALSPSGAVEPAPIASVQANVDLEVCMYVGCASGETMVECGSQMQDTQTDTGGNPGCCGIGSAQVLSYTCVGSVELNGNAYARVQAAEPIEACVPYVATLASE